MGREYPTSDRSKRYDHEKMHILRIDWHDAKLFRQKVCLFDQQRSSNADRQEIRQLITALKWHSAEWTAEMNQYRIYNSTMRY